MPTTNAWAVVVEEGDGSVRVAAVYTSRDSCTLDVQLVANEIAAQSQRRAHRMEGHDTPTWIVTSYPPDDIDGDDNATWVYLKPTRLTSDLDIGTSGDTRWDEGRE